jgi:hypothetical protein
MTAFDAHAAGASQVVMDRAGDLLIHAKHLSSAASRTA